MGERAVVTCILRHETHILLLRLGETTTSDAGHWDGVTGGVEGSPDSAAREVVDDAVGSIENVTLVRSGDPVTVVDETGGTRRIVHPYLFEYDPGTPPKGESPGSMGDPSVVEPAEDVTEWTWIQPPAILERPTVGKLWETYASVAPTLETVRSDHEHGSAYVSLRALEVLRDRAAALARGRGSAALADPRTPDSGGNGFESLTTLALDLRHSRPSMGVLRTRIDRIMAHAESTPAGIRDAAMTACSRAVDADREAASKAAESIGDRPLTLSRSATVMNALAYAAPEAIFVAESRPAREGVDVAETLSETTDADVTLCVDAAIGHVIERAGVDTVVVGADSVRGDGTAINKVGTRLAALAAADRDIDCYVACARDKITHERDPDDVVDLEAGPPTEIYEGEADVAATNPTFEPIPPRLYEGPITEDGILERGDVERIAAEHADAASWVVERRYSSGYER